MGQMVLLMDGMRQARHGQAYFTDIYVFTPLYQSVKQHRIYATKSPFPRQAAFLEGVAYWGGHEVGWQAKVSRWYSWSGGGGGVRGGAKATQESLQDLLACTLSASYGRGICMHTYIFIVSYSIVP